MSVIAVTVRAVLLSIGAKPRSQRSPFNKERPSMSNRGDKWAGLVSGYPNFFSPYWCALPLGRMKMFLAGYFFVGAAGGFALDLMQLNCFASRRRFLLACLSGHGSDGA